MEHSGLSELPELNRAILLKLSYPEIIKFCSTSQENHKLFSDDLFWRMKLEQEFPGASQFNPEDLPFHQFYLQFYQSRDQIQAAKNGHLAVLKWMASREIPPTQELIEHAVRGGHHDVLDWLHEEVYVNQDEIFPAIENEDLETLQWFVSNGHIPWTNEAIFSAHFNKLIVLEWLHKNDFLPFHVDVANAAAKGGAYEALDWLAKLGLLPDQAVLRSAIKGANFRLLGWLNNHGVSPTREHVSLAKSYSDFRVIDWLDHYLDHS